MIAPAHQTRVPRSGFTLIEMTLVLATMGIGLLVGTAVLIGASRMERAAAASQHQVATRGMLADQFREDVARADRLPEQLEKRKAGPTCLILGLPDGGHVVYQREGGRLQRVVIAKSGKATQPDAVGPECTGVVFSRSGPGNPLVTLTIQEPGMARGPERHLVIAAALGGDTR